LITSTSSIQEACNELLKRANASDYERITLFYGEDMHMNQVSQIADHIRSEYPDHEVEIHDGGQPHYQLIIAIE